MNPTRRRTPSHTTARRALAALGALGALALAPRPARAHFILQAPACYSRQDSLGSPQKSAPCGQADPGTTLTPTGAVTAFVSGGMITLTIDEVIPHPGHYRVLIAQDMNSLPADPPVMAGATACGSTTITTTPALPLLADGLLVHTSPFSGPQTVQIPLPAGFTCDHCVLQVVEFMSSHGLNNPGGCFYHHCATVSVVAPGDDAGLPPPDSGTRADSGAERDTGAGSDAGTGTDTGATMDAASTQDGGTNPPRAGSCSCSVHPSARAPGAAGASALLVAGLGLAGARRRRRARRA